MREYTDLQRRKAAQNATKHGLCGKRIYKTFHQMKQRCYNPNNPSYPNYGGRGIIICDEWLDNIELFVEWAYKNGWSESKTRDEQTIDRIDVNGNYCPENCRLIPMNEQYFNRTDTHYIIIDGATRTIKEWSEISGVSMTVINTRIEKFGWDEKKAVFTPARKMRKRTGPVTYKGETHSISEWSKITGISIQTLSNRFSEDKYTLDEVFYKGKLQRKSSCTSKSKNIR